MRERAFTTAVIWVALAFSIDRMISAITVTTSSAGDFALGVLMFVLILAAMGGTLAIWTSVNNKSEAEQSEKAKRSERDARIKRLMATLDDDELESLEQRRREEARSTVGDDGEHQSLESLLRKR